MTRKLLVILPDGSESVLDEVLVHDEQSLHERLRHTPGLLPVEDFGLDGPLLVVGQETSLASGRIDLVGLTRSGDLLLIEFKTGPQNPDFRAALAQLLDYGSDLWQSTVEGFENAVVRRYLSSPYCTDPAIKGATSLNEAIQRAWPGIADEEIDLLRGRLDVVLRDGEFHFVVVAQRFTASMENTVRYLNASADRGRYFLVELVRFVSAHPTITAYAGQVVAQPERKIAAGTPTGVNEAQFLGALDDDGYRQALERLFDACKANGLVFEWGVKGASIRLPTADRAEPVSVAWIFPAGSHWYGLCHLSLGHDPATLTRTPSVAQAVRNYATAAQAVPGAQPVGTKSLVAVTFRPDTVVTQEHVLTELITSLVADANNL